MLTDDRAVRIAEQALSERKALLSRRWHALRAGFGNKLVEPATLVTAGLVGGVFGWRAGNRKQEAGIRCECPAQETKPSLLSGALRSVAIAGLQVIASIATEELVRSTVSRGTEAKDGSSSEAAGAAD